MAFFVDTFTEATNTTLASHTPDTGTSWTQLWSDGATLEVMAIPDTLSPSTTGNSGCIYTADATYPSADYEVEFTIVSFSATASRKVYAFVRIQDQENMYAVQLNGSANGQLYKKVAGTWSTLGTSFTAPANGSVCKLQIIGTALKFFDDTVEVASATDSSITAAGKAGLGAGGGAELVTSTDDSNGFNELDSFSVTDLGAAPAGDSIPYLTDLRRRRFQPLLVR